MLIHPQSTLVPLCVLSAKEVDYFFIKSKTMQCRNASIIIILKYTYFVATSIKYQYFKKKGKGQFEHNGQRKWGEGNSYGEQGNGRGIADIPHQS